MMNNSLNHLISFFLVIILFVQILEFLTTVKVNEILDHLKLLLPNPMYLPNLMMLLLSYLKNKSFNFHILFIWRYFFKSAIIFFSDSPPWKIFNFKFSVWNLPLFSLKFNCFEINHGFYIKIIFRIILSPGNITKGNLASFLNQKKHKFLCFSYLISKNEPPSTVN